MRPFFKIVDFISHLFSLRSLRQVVRCVNGIMTAMARHIPGSGGEFVYTASAMAQ